MLIKALSCKAGVKLFMNMIQKLHGLEEESGCCLAAVQTFYRSVHLETQNTTKKTEDC